MGETRQGEGDLQTAINILNRHRARLTIESEPGQGALFSVRFDESSLIPSIAADDRKSA